MPHNRSLLAIMLIFLIAFSIRLYWYQEHSQRGTFCLTTYDAFGYYMYLPAGLIYQDMTQLNWVDSIHVQYRVKGGDALYQATKTANGSYVFKYLGGVALLQAPFFGVAHWLAPLWGATRDGFSLPYQWAVIAAAFFYGLLGLFWLRQFLLSYFSDITTAWVLLLTGLATNWLQYISVDSGMSHIYIFPLYALVLLRSRQWHLHPQAGTAFTIGCVIGLATMTRPTEAIMLFIPLLWDTYSKEAAAKKWALVQTNKMHLLWAVAGGILGILPQIIYWKYAAGQWIFDVGSKWYFLNPYFRVLFGFEKGWFVYTPATILFVLGFWYLRGKPFQRSVIIFGLLNFWIITAWADWRYGGSYSCRALVQSYPVYAVAMAAFWDSIWVGRRKWLLVVIALYLIGVNLFQIYQYNAGILRYDENTLEYYRSIYLNPYALPYPR